MKRFQPRWPARWLASAMVAFAIVSTAAVARADTAAESFVSEHANEALQILNDGSAPLADKKARFRALVEDVADVPRITRFVLGRYARGLDDASMSAFSEVFSAYAIGVYESRLGDYAGETLVVTGSTDRAPGDTVVHTQVSGGSQSQPLPVNWRVLTNEGVHKVVDVEVYGVWLAINQRDEITSIINNNSGRVAAAIDALRTKIQEQEVAGG